MASQLNILNNERKEIEADMHKEAFAILDNLKLAEKNLPLGLCLYEKSWHQGVVGILASRVKDKLHRPVIAFALANETEIKGSGRSIVGLHLRDVLEAIAIKSPGLLTKFGGHAMAAGVTLQLKDYQLFNKLFIDEVASRISESDLESVIHTDGELPHNYFTLDTVQALQNGGPWGHGFPEPVFDDIFDVVGQRLVGQKHLQLSLRLEGTNQEVAAIQFNADTKIWPNYRCSRAHVAFKLAVNEYNGRRNLQLIVEQLSLV
jgi:single-stranded-DNA-specific exonuclease